MKPIDATNEKFELISLFGKPTLFTSLRLDRKTIPDGLNAYDIRHADEDGFDAAGIKPYVMVNHMGTIITKETFEFEKNDDFVSDIEIGDDDFLFLDGGNLTMQEYIDGGFKTDIDIQKDEGMSL